LDALLVRSIQTTMQDDPVLHGPPAGFWPVIPNFAFPEKWAAGATLPHVPSPLTTVLQQGLLLHVAYSRTPLPQFAAGHRSVPWILKPQGNTYFPALTVIELLVPTTTC